MLDDRYRGQAHANIAAPIAVRGETIAAIPFFLILVLLPQLT